MKFCHGCADLRSAGSRKGGDTSMPSSGICAAADVQLHFVMHDCTWVVSTVHTRMCHMHISLWHLVTEDRVLASCSPPSPL